MTSWGAGGRFIFSLRSFWLFFFSFFFPFDFLLKHSLFILAFFFNLWVNHDKDVLTTIKFSNQKILIGLRVETSRKMISYIEQHSSLRRQRTLENRLGKFSNGHADAAKKIHGLKRENYLTFRSAEQIQK